MSFVEDTLEKAGKYALATVFTAAALYLGSGVLFYQIDKEHAKLGSYDVDARNLPIVGPLYAPFNYEPPANKP